MVPFPERQEGHPPAIPAGIGFSVRLIPPNMANGIDTECGIEDKKDSTKASQEETPQSAHPAIGDEPDQEGK